MQVGHIGMHVGRIAMFVICGSGEARTGCLVSVNRLTQNFIVENDYSCYPPCNEDAELCMLPTPSDCKEDDCSHICVPLDCMFYLVL